MAKELRSFKEISLSLFNQTKNTLVQHSLKEWLQIIKSQAITYYYDFREKAKNLKKTNIELALYHFYKGNFSDAKFRFKFVKFFWPEISEAEYFLGRVYFYEKAYIKAQLHFNNYLASSDNKFIEEANYCLKIIEDQTSDIQSIPVSILKEKFDIFSNFNTSLPEIETELNPHQILIDNVLKFINSIAKPSINKVLDIDCGGGFLGKALKAKVNISYLTGIDISKARLEQAKTLNSSGQKVYDELLQYNAIEYLENLNNAEKFDIILAYSTFNYYANIEKLAQLIASKTAEKNSLFAFFFNVNDNQESRFNPHSEEFSFTDTEVKKMLSRNGFNIIHQEFLTLNLNQRGSIIISQKI